MGMCHSRCTSLELLVDSSTCRPRDGQWVMPVTRADSGCAGGMGGMGRETQGSVRPSLPLVPSSSWGSPSPSTALTQEKEAPDLAAWGWETQGAVGRGNSFGLIRGAPLCRRRLLSAPELIMFCNLSGGRDAAGFDGLIKASQRRERLWRVLINNLLSAALNPSGFVVPCSWGSRWERRGVSKRASARH